MAVRALALVAVAVAAFAGVAAGVWWERERGDRYQLAVSGAGIIARINTRTGQAEVVWQGDWRPVQGWAPKRNVFGDEEAP